MRLRLLLTTGLIFVLAASAAQAAPRNPRTVEAAFLNCTGPCGAVQLLRAADKRSVDVLSSLHGVIGAGAGAGSVYRLAASRRPCGRPAGRPYIIVEAPPVAGADDDFRVQTVRTRKGLRPVRSIRILEVAGNGTAKQVACSRSFVPSGVEAVFSNCTGPCGVVQALRALNGQSVDVVIGLHGLRSGMQYRVDVSRRPCSQQDANPFISVQLPTDDKDDQFIAPTEQTQGSLKRVRSIRIVEAPLGGAISGVTCTNAFVMVQYFGY